jgi:hypothetical protein
MASRTIAPKPTQHASMRSENLLAVIPLLPVSLRLSRAKFKSCLTLSTRAVISRFCVGNLEQGNDFSMKNFPQRLLIPRKF